MKNILLAVLLLFCSLVNAQIVFEKGYFIDQKDTKVSCYIRNVDWLNNPKEFNYKLAETDSVVKTGDISTVKEFALENGSKYKRFKVKIERSQTTMSTLTDNRYPVFREEVVFLKTLVEGTANLYKFSSENITKYFIEKNPVLPIEQLISIKYTSDNDRTIRWNNQFRQQLLNNTKCPNMTERNFTTINYNEKELTQHFTTYNTCTGGTSMTYKQEVPGGKVFALSVRFAASAATLQVTDPSTAYNVNSKFSGIEMKIGFEAEYFLPFNKNTWSIVTDPAFLRFNVDKDFSKLNGLNNGGNAINYSATADYKAFDLPIGIRYHIYTKKGDDLFLNGFFGYQFQTGSILTFNNDKNFVNAKKELDINSGYYVAFGCGYKYKKFSAELRTTLTRDLLSGNYTYWSGKYSSIGLILGYQVFLITTISVLISIRLDTHHFRSRQYAPALPKHKIYL